MMVLMLGSHFRFREIVDPRNLKDSTANTVLLCMMRGGSAGGLLLESTVISSRVQLQVVATAPQGQLFNLPSICRLVFITDVADDCCVVCKFQELNRRVS